MKKLEELQKEKLGIGYIKSYPILKKLKLSPLKVEILQLILSYQSNNQDFYMPYSKIAKILSSTTNSITKNISELNTGNYIQTIHSSNYNGEEGGSSTTIKVNMDYIIDLLTSNQLSNDNDSDIPQEIRKSLKSKKKDIIEKQVENKTHRQRYVDELNNLDIKK